MPMFPELVAPIQNQLDAAEAESERLKAAVKENKGNVRRLKKMLREANGETHQLKKGAKS